MCQEKNKSKEEKIKELRMGTAGVLFMAFLLAAFCNSMYDPPPSPEDFFSNKPKESDNHVFWVIFLFFAIPVTLNYFIMKKRIEKGIDDSHCCCCKCKGKGILDEDDSMNPASISFPISLRDED